MRDENDQIVRWCGSAYDIEDRKQTEFFLAEGQRLSHTGSWAFSPAGFDYWSSELFKIHGLDASGKAPSVEEYMALVHPDDRKFVVATIEKMFAEHGRFDFTKRILRPDGKIRRVRCVGSPAADGGIFQGFVGTGVDVTEQEQLTEALRKSEEQWRDVFQNNPTMYFMVDPVGTILAVNPFGAERLGYAIDELVGDTIFKLFCEADQDAAQEHVAVCLKELGQSFSWELCALHKNGSKLWVREMARAVLRDNGPIILIAYEDITDRKEAEQKLQERELQLKLLTETLPALLWKAEPGGKIVYANKRAIEYTGRPLEQMQQKGWIDLVHPSDLAETLRHWKRLLEGSDGYHTVHRLLGNGGQYRWFHTSVAVVRDEKGRTLAFHGVMVDVTVQRNAENARLEERTRIAQELHDTLLQTFQSASLHLGGALYRVAQDSPVKRQLDRILLIMNRGIAEGRNAIQGLRRADSRTSDLVAALSRIHEELKAPLDVDVRVIVAGRQSQLPQEIEHQIYRIGKEALVNAFRHSGAKRVELELEYTDSELHLRVRDDGCGIDSQVLTEGRDGHWGLAGMRERATRIGGLLKIVSSAAEGTEVQLSIPTSIALEHSLSHGSAE
ncbi:MAG TPA: PAS domain S-box protein [Bryobacteraceae bacterium]